MNEHPQNPDIPDPEGDDCEEAVDFGFVAGGEESARPFASARETSLEGAEPDVVVGKRGFGAAIGALHTALLGYEQALETRHGEITAAIHRPSTDPELFAAADSLHEALEELAAAHQVYTGRGLPEKLPGRTVTDEPGAPAAWEHLLSDDDAGGDADESRWPRPDELGATLVLDRILHHSDAELLRLDTAKVFGNGVMLVIDYVNLRGVGEDGLSWFRRSNDQLGDVEITLQLHDPTTARTYSCERYRAEGNVGAHCYMLNQHFWIHRAPRASELAGSLTVTDAIAVDGSAEPLVIELRLDTAPLRQAATRIRTLGPREPRA